jgi:hypothetical protein
MTCYGCGEKGHIAKDLKCKNFRKSKPGAKMFVAQEILDEDDDRRADDEVVDQDKESGGHDENDQTPWDQYDMGSQYSTEGEEVKFDEFGDGHWDHVDRVEQMYALRIKSMNLLDYHNKFASVLQSPTYSGRTPRTPESPGGFRWNVEELHIKEYESGNSRNSGWILGGFQA